MPGPDVLRQGPDTDAQRRGPEPVAVQLERLQDPDRPEAGPRNSLMFCFHKPMLVHADWTAKLPVPILIREGEISQEAQMIPHRCLGHVRM